MHSHDNDDMKVNLLLNPANRSWIIQKIAENLAKNLLPFDVQARITDTVDETADLVHHMSWAFANIKTHQPSTMFITHLDDIYKLNQVRSTLAAEVRVGICMSTDTMKQLLSNGCDAAALYFINPAHDGLIHPRRVVIGITSRVYPDGRKREALLREVAGRVDLSPFVFRIFGLGWERTIVALKSAGAEVEYFGETDDFRKDYEVLQAAIPHFDYYLYLGMDEGSLGTLDALAAGVATIVTPQGFHLDLAGGITHPVVSGEDLLRVLTEIATTRNARIAAVSELTWSAYASRHLSLWRSILDGQAAPELPLNAGAADGNIEAMGALRQQQLYANAMSPRRLISAISHWPPIKPLRRSLDRLRLKK